MSIRKDKAIDPTEKPGDDGEYPGDIVSAGKFINGQYYTRE